MGNGLRVAIVGIAGIGAVLVTAVAGAQATATATVTKAPDLASTGAVVAILGERPITASEVESRVKARVFKARQDEYDAQVDGIHELAFELAQDQQAAKVGLTREAYYKREVTDKVSDPSADEVQQIFTTYRARLPKDDEAARAEVRRVLRNRNAQQRTEQFKNDLLAGAKLRITLDPPRLGVPVEANDPSVGPENAAVTVLEFSDFQCPYCQRGQTVVKQLRTEYGDRVRFAFKQLPLGMHPQARLAAEAALCASDQAKYWEARDWMFSHQGGVTADALKAWSKEAGLDADAFAKCIDGNAHAKDVEADMATAEAAATSSTPTFFINGRLLQGALPVAQFREVIDDELARATPRDPAAAKP
jgi:protein-disulfide isomerase